MARQLGIKQNELWAYKETLSRGPLVRVRVLHPGYGYESQIRVRREDTGAVLYCGRARLPCKWDERELYLESHPEFATERPNVTFDDLDPVPIFIPRVSEVDLERIRSIVHEEVQSVRTVPRLAFSVRELAEAVGLSDEQLYRHIARGDLVAKYSGSKKLITVAEAHRFVDSLPEEPLGPL